MNIENEDQARAFLRALIQEMNTQDNRATATPYFYVVRTPRWRVCKEGYGAGSTRTVRVDWSGDPTVYRSKGEYIQQKVRELLWDVVEGDKPLTTRTQEEELDIQRRKSQAVETAEGEWDELPEYEEEKYYEEENVFFTEKGYKKHVEQNGHNLAEDHFNYIKHAFRNPELKNLFQAVGILVGEPWKER